MLPIFILFDVNFIVVGYKSIFIIKNGSKIFNNNLQNFKPFFVSRSYPLFIIQHIQYLVFL